MILWCDYAECYMSSTDWEYLMFADIVFFGENLPDKFFECSSAVSVIWCNDYVAALSALYSCFC